MSSLSTGRIVAASCAAVALLARLPAAPAQQPCEAAKLLASDGAAYDYFGWSVSLSGDMALVGAYSDDDHGTNSGSAYVFRRDPNGRWIREPKLLASDGAAHDYFGYSVSLSGDRALVGAGWDDDRGYHSGSAYVFRRDPNGLWVQEAKLLASDGAVYDYFGYSVCLSGDRALVGAYGDDDRGWDSGSAYAFRRDPNGLWVQEAKLLASDGAVYDYFGYSVSLSGDTALIGAYWDDDRRMRSGSAYVFALAGDDCNANGVFDACDIAKGSSQDRNGNGVPDECECFGDLDRDGDTDTADLATLLGDWGCRGGRCEGDVDRDGDTDQADLAILLSDWGCGEP